MSAISTFSKRLNNVTIPDVPAHNPSLTEEAFVIGTVFSTQVNACKGALAKCRPTNSEEISQKREKLKELGLRIQKFRASFPEETVPYKELLVSESTIAKERQKLLKECRTISYCLIETVRRSHLVEIAEDDERILDAKKIDPYDVPKTLDRVDKIDSGVLKVRLLQKLIKMILDEQKKVNDELDLNDTPALQAKSEGLRSSLEEIEHYAQFNLPDQETFLALRQISARDKDAVQDEELRKMVDPTGKRQIVFLLNHTSWMGVLATNLSALLAHRFYRSPAKSPFQTLLEWPDSKTVKQSEAKRQEFLGELDRLQESKQTDPFMPLVLDYLHMVFDPEGKVGAKAILVSALPSGEKCRRLAQMAIVMNRFQLDGKLFLENVPIANGSSAKKLDEGLLALPFLQKKKYSKEEIRPLAQAFKAEAVKVFLAFDFDSFAKKDTVFGEAYLKIDNFYNQFRSFCVASIKNAKDRKVVLSNLTLLATELAGIGELNISFNLFIVLSGYSKEAPKNEFLFLQNLFSPSLNWSNMRRFCKAKSEKGELCNLLLPRLKLECGNLAEQISKHREIHWKFIKSTLDDSQAASLFKLVLSDKKIEGSLEEWAENHLFDDWELLFTSLRALNLPVKPCQLPTDPQIYTTFKGVLERHLRDETELRLEIEARYQQIDTLRFALDLYYRGYQRPPAMEAVLTEIAQIKIEE